MLSLLALTVAALPGTRASAGSPDRAPDSCADCHSSYREPRLSAPVAEVRRSVHRGLERGCNACHESDRWVGSGPEHGARTGRVSWIPRMRARADARQIDAVCGGCHPKTSGFAHAEARERGQSVPSCMSCHLAHETRVGEAAEILSAAVGCAGVACHAEVRTFGPKGARPHRVCGSCHDLHEEDAKGACLECHGVQLRGLKKSRAPREHLECTSCHPPHDVRNPGSTCRRCHEEQAQQLSKTRHERCTDCHRPHEPGGAQGAWTRCPGCHEPLVGEARAKGKHEACRTCHEPHLFPKPSCAACHTQLGDRMIHRVPKHRESCSDCHTHDGARPAKSACLECHKDRRKHFPAAELCSACHPFATGEPGTAPEPERR
ncbi:MAG: hypothetical protein HY791_24390 [Deltaproteobacteria bacterium]|nr:hypothetical protein [Deltaproteobacteria bacterium]